MVSGTCGRTNRVAARSRSAVVIEGRTIGVGPRARGPVPHVVQTARPRPRATTIRALARRHRSRTIVIATQAAAVIAGGHCSVKVVGGAVSIPQAIFANSSPTASWTPRMTSRGKTAPESVQPARGAQDHEDRAHEQRPGGDHVGTGTGGDRGRPEGLQRLDGDRHAVPPGDDQVQQAGGQQDGGGRQPVAHDQCDRYRDEHTEVGDRTGGLPPPRRAFVVALYLFVGRA